MIPAHLFIPKEANSKRVPTLYHVGTAFTFMVLRTIEQNYFNDCKDIGRENGGGKSIV